MSACRRPEHHPTAWCNDTLCGRLLDWVRPEDLHLRNKIGFWRMLEERMIRAELGPDWEAQNPGKWIGFEISRRITANHAHDPSLRELQEAARLRAPPPAPDAGPFTLEELERMAEHFANANDPVARSIAARASRLIAG